ncbi:MAG: hypothetical protein EOR73_29465 [Mesorhizobium sp.]|nr:MAG: hypothetical protein EOR73_29465 [Mesorhizobium sp.]
MPHEQNLSAKAFLMPFRGRTEHAEIDGQSAHQRQALASRIIADYMAGALEEADFFRLPNNRWGGKPE